jgi:signal transduction histidine kinase
MARATRVLLKIQRNADLRTVRSDRRRIKQIVGNLISNAIKYRRQERSDASVETLFMPLPGECWQLIVRDTGIGIASDQLANIFQEFQRVAPAGGNPRRGPRLSHHKALGRSIARRDYRVLRGGEGSSVYDFFPDEAEVKRPAPGCGLWSRKRAAAVARIDRLNLASSSPGDAPTHILLD